MQPDDPPALVLGSGITALGAIRALGRSGHHAIAVTRSDPLLRRSRWFHPLPAGVESPTERTLEAWLEGSPWKQAVLIPCSDHWASAVAALSAKTRERFRASISESATLERFLDKGQFANLLDETATPHPFSRLVESANDLEAVPAHVFDSAMLKPRDSQAFIRRFDVKAMHVRSRHDAVAQLEPLVREGYHVIVQEYIPGPPSNHYLVDGFIDRAGDLRAVFVRQRLRMYPLDFGNSTYMLSVPPEAASGAVSSIVSLMRHVNYHGMFSAEFKLDSRDRVFKLLEVNARAWWYVDFAARCGVNVCDMAYRDALERPVASVTSYAVGRHLVYPKYDFFACASTSSNRARAVARCARSWVGAMQPVFQMADPGPSVRELAATLPGIVWRRVKRSARSIGAS